MNDYPLLPLKSWSVEERPREKVIANGIQFLSDTELLAILVRSGTRNMTAVELARNILDQSGHNLLPLLGDLDHEEFWLLMLNRANKVLGRFKVSQGGLSGTVIDTRIILKKALDNLASSIIVCHTHPSGNT